ncbi:FkbM family methyltransferase [Flavobacterium jejuense]|uniref:FkbM family methyltransferase n=1 Tax=Flavobacterium jejuense TaxID=1544455 RepID=A0ABX0IPW8_9FLAO|nr:FkbM family methyltransferase [Flavobacterium jejuense]NHN25611.1 FkbM family methyltransferase [Flavobacterium jejuense]
MRRIKILFFWIFFNKNNISFSELIRFLIKPKVSSIARKYIYQIIKNGDYEISFNNLDKKLYWPSKFSISRLNQVIAESFDIEDWHYYQKTHTEINVDEVVLDIGTAEGLLPLSVVDKCKYIYMIEPSTLFCNCLSRTFSDYKNKTTIFNVAVGNEDGIINFDENSLDGMISNENTSFSNEIPINKVDTLLNNQIITYLKADIEGFELEMLKGAEQTIKRNQPKIAITTYHTQNNPKEIIDLIKSFVPEYNYYVKGIYEKTPKPVLIHFWI